MPPAAPPKTSVSSKKSGPLSPFPSRTHWTLALNNQLIAPPAFDEGVGYFPIEGDRLVAYDLTPGTQRWMVSAKPRSVPAVGRGLLFLDQGETLSALRTTDGSTAWTVPLSDKLATPLVWDNGSVIAATAAELGAFRDTDGTLLWHQPVAGARAAPAVFGDRVYVSLEDGRVLAFRTDTGSKVWERKLGGAPNEILALDDGIFVGSADNFLYSLKPADGTIEWRWRTGADVLNTATFDADRVYFVSLDNVLRALNRSNGAQQWKRALPFRPLWAPVKAADTVIVSGVLGPPLAFFMKDGATAGEFSVTLSTPILPSAFGLLPLAQLLAPRSGLESDVIAILPGRVPVDIIPGQVAPLVPPPFPTAPGSSEIVAAPYAFQAVGTLGPMLFVIRRAIGLGANVAAVSRLIEPVPTVLTAPPLPLPLPAAPVATAPDAALVPVVPPPII